MTALAAVVALSSTPLLAQSVDEPIVTTTPPIDVTPAPVAADPVVTAPVIDTAADPLAAEAAPAIPVRKATPVKTAAARSRPAAARASSAPIVAAAPAAAITAPVAEVPVAQPLPPPTEIAAEPIARPATANSTMNDMLPAAGIGGAALVLLAGAGLAVRRRRRRAQEAEDAEWQYAEADAEAAAEPAMIAEPQPALELTEPAYIEPVREPAAPALAAAAALAPGAAEEAPPEVEGPVTELPEGFDLSRFGFNVQAAYKGPTEDNPSLSLKHRLRRASGMDSQERKLDAEVEAVTGEPVLDESDLRPPAEEPAAKPAVAHPATGDFMLGRAGKKPSLSPTYTH